MGNTPYTLVSFEKTNGMSREVFGAKVYIIEYRATVEYPEGLRPECVSHNGSFSGWSCSLAQSQGTQPKSIGERETTTGELAFEQTEKGWKGQDGNIY